MKNCVYKFKHIYNSTGSKTQGKKHTVGIDGDGTEFKDDRVHPRGPPAEHLRHGTKA